MKKPILTFALMMLFLTGCKHQQEIQPNTTPENQTPPTIEDRPTSAGKTKGQAFKYYDEKKDYATDGKNIYINAYDGGSNWAENYQIAKNIDQKTFELLSADYTNYFKDKNGVYYNALATDDLDRNLKILDRIDPQTVKVVSYDCIKDKNGVYCDLPYLKKANHVRMRVMPEADSETFLSIGENEGYFKDKNNIFCNQDEKGVNLKKLENVDAGSFELVPNDLDSFAKDKNSVFHLCNKLGHSDPGTFKILENSTYQKDKNNVYFEGWTMEGADPDSFVIFNIFLTKDKNAVYVNGQKAKGIADPASFVAENFTNGKDKFNKYEFVSWGDEKGIVVTKTPLEK